MADTIRRIAIWSGPRGISTAMMRSWGNRPDTFVVDEPLYAHYLLKTRAPHPGADEVIRSQECDWPTVVRRLTEFVPPGKRVFYQKHMAHHLLPEVDRTWLARVQNGFLIREPRAVLASFSRIVPHPRLEDTGLPQQLEIFSMVKHATGRVPPVLDAGAVLANPEAQLRLLCDALEVEFSPAMLSWPPGPRETDGVWGRYWYGSVNDSTGFRERDTAAGPVPSGLEDLILAAEEIYYALREHRLGA